MHAIVVALAAAFAVACGRGGHAVLDGAGNAAGSAAGDAVGRSDAAPVALAAPSAIACGHAVCGDDFFVDAVPVGDCAAGGTCAVALTLVATGDYHINDAYPYAFKAQADPRITLLGAGGEGRAVFSKADHDWTKRDDKVGTMHVAFTPRGPQESPTVLAGVFKLSVCSRENCRLERPEIRAIVAVR
jgi:hypothetical protein